jgi:CofD-related protein of GAK system
MLTNNSSELPNPVFLESCLRTPELGPCALFFSGGSALKDISRILKQYSHNTIHLVTPFDSGGSSAKLRQVFSMPSVGDLRSRIISLSDESFDDHIYIHNLFVHRLPSDKQNGELTQELISMIDGSNPLVQPIQNPMKQLICSQLDGFLKSMPNEFDLRGASIGNLVLTGGYLNHHRELDKITFLFSKLVGTKGIVRTTISDDLHLTATLEDSTQIIGQHLITGKETTPITSPIYSIELSSDANKFVPATAKISKSNKKLIAMADIICYPPGSFYSSLIANLLPQGVGSAISNNPAPKIFIPNLGNDPEQLGMSLATTIETLLKYLRKDTGEDCPTNKLLNVVLVDSTNGNYNSPISRDNIESLGIRLVDTTLITDKSFPYYDPELLVGALLSIS